MKLFAWWSSPKPSPDLTRAREEVKELRTELTQSVVKFERRRSQIEQVADDAMAFMNERRK